MQYGSNAPFPRQGEKVRLLAFAAAYPHKNLAILPEIAANLRSLVPTLDFEIVITIPTDDPLSSEIADRSKRLGVADHVVNQGPVAVADGPALYQSCNICLLPTLLEVFTATYPEAMAMGLPIVTTDLDFARNICGEAALYYRPQDARHAAETIVQLLANGATWLNLVTNGHAILKKLPTVQQRYRSIVNFLKANL
jgi:glycosyltransferase involved in cell wall biosynthesis